MRPSLALAVSRHALNGRISSLGLGQNIAIGTRSLARLRSIPSPSDRSRWTSTISPRPVYVPSSRDITSSSAEPPTPLPRSINPSTALLLLTVPQPPTSWPAKLDFASPLLGLASRALKSKGVVVNAVWDGVSRPENDDFVGEGEEVYPARLFFPDGTSHSFERFHKGMLFSDELRRVLGKGVDRAKALSPDGIARQEGGAVGAAGGEKGLEILVCTHGSRDCRCGDIGGELVVALREEIERRGLEGVVRVGEVAHVGGHKYAANAILLPSLDMLSNLRPAHVPHLLTWWLSGRDRADDMWQFWRGRYGLSEVEQAGVWGGTGWAHGEEKIAEKLGPSTEHGVPAEKVRLRFKTYEGEMRDVEASLGESLLTVGKREGLPAIEGVCGGKLECATCHVYIPPSAPISEASEAELDMLGYALAYRDGESRLGCQISVTRELADWAAGAEGIVSLPRY